MDNLTVEVRYSQSGQSFNAGLNVPPVFYEAFQSMKETDMPELCDVLNEHLTGSEQIEVIAKLRKDAAEYIAAALTDHLLKLMSSQDTFNGYKVEANNG